MPQEQGAERHSADESPRGGAGPSTAGAVVPSQGGPRATEFQLAVGERKVLQFRKKSQIAAIAELVWNGLDANATRVDVELRRSSWDAVTEIVVTDNGHGMTSEQARTAFQTYGKTWKTGTRHTAGGTRILHGRNGEGRLFAFALGDRFTWESAVEEDGTLPGVRISGDAERADIWTVEDAPPVRDRPGTVVRIEVPQGKNLRALESEDTAANLTAKLAFYLRAYPDVCVTFDGKRLDPAEIMVGDPVDLPLDLPEEYAQDDPPPVVTFVEWNQRMSDRKTLICNSDGIALYEEGREWSDSIVSFTPYLRSGRFDEAPLDDLHMLPMTHGSLMDAAAKAVREHLEQRGSEISAAVVRQLKEEGIYPYPEGPATDIQSIERKAFDVVVTVARDALPHRGAPRSLSVGLIRTALERSPGDLHAVLEKVLALTDEDQRHLRNLLDSTELTDVIGAATTVTNRLNFLGGLRKMLADEKLRTELREVDQLHPMVAQNLWLFGEDWAWARTEVGLTNVLQAHLEELGEDVALENRLQPVRQPDGRDGRVDILMFRTRRSDNTTERIVIELKRPTVRVGEKELRQIKGYARAIVDDPQYKGVDCRWTFYLVTYDYSDRIQRDIRQKGRPDGLCDDQDDYQVWVKSWGEILDTAEKKMRFFQQQLQYEATDERETRHLRESYAHFVPEGLGASPPGSGRASGSPTRDPAVGSRGGGREEK